jgi:hypothetical protein
MVVFAIFLIYFSCCWFWFCLSRFGSFVVYLLTNVVLLLMLHVSSSFVGMAGKAKVADVNDAFILADTMSVDDLFTKKAKKNSRKASEPLKETGVKKARLASTKEAGSTHPVPSPTVSPDISGSQVQGKSRFYVEYIHLSDDLVCGQLFGHGELRLSSRPGDYGDMQVYSGLSSSGKMNSAKEETYRIACSLGAVLSSRVIANVDYRAIRLLPNPGVASFTDACAGLFSALELRRDLLKVPNLSLIDAVNFHAASVSGYVFICIHFTIYFLPCSSFMCRL